MNYRKLFNQLKQERGFSLVELMAALTVLTIVTMTFTGIIGDAAILSGANKLENVAALLAQEKMEEIKAAWPTRVEDLNGKVFPDPGDKVTKNGVVFGRVYTVEQAETPVSYGANTVQHNLLKVIVTVSWTERNRTGSKVRSINMVTYLTGR